MKTVKTNAMRLLEKEKVKYEMHDFLPLGEDEELDYETISQRTRVEKERIFKTIVTVGASKLNYVFVVQGIEELDLKKAARSVGEKNIELLHVKDLEKTTGYIRGGCSPLGMKKLFTTVFDDRVNDFETIMVSAGKRGYQIEANPEDLVRLSKASINDIKRS